MLKASTRRIGWILMAATCGAAFGQRTGTESKGVTERRAQATALRDSFVKATVAAGMSCPIAPPKIVVEDVPGYASYDSATNTLKTGAWEQLTDDEKSRFFGMLGPGTTEDAARAEFEIGANHWVFVRELESWWLACRKVSEMGSAYAFESGVNRVEAAYWRQQNASVIEHMRGVFQIMQKNVPSPVPVGEGVEAYYDARYPDKFKGPPEYLWFQARMCLAVFDEKPSPTFAQALKDMSSSK
ncbi:hypothetical protein [Granulicella sibirica]|uniref:Uncharacterized protein n=1 Tax=Granulicella sibirica TaxID=2479048 RepID=A0A4Q0T3G3_9BACT|nr:hypothetical protein [Granulicella sibirica]RXH56548.1 hypothetical protein GRAN_3405 [Granulicella sibirica]